MIQLPRPRRSGKSREQEIADVVGLGRQTVTDKINELPDLTQMSKPAKLSALFEDGSTQQEIADAVGVTKKTIDNRLEECVNLDRCPKLHKLSALFEDDGFSIQHLHISDLRQSVFMGI